MNVCKNACVCHHGVGGKDRGVFNMEENSQRVSYVRLKYLD